MVLEVSVREVYEEIRRYPAKRFPLAGLLLAWFSFRRLFRMAQRYEPAGSPGYKTDFLEFVDPLFRDDLARIFASHFESESRDSSRDVFARSQELAQWITSPMCEESALTPVNG